MKKILFSLCILSTLLSMVGCEKPTYTPESADPTIALEPTSLSLFIGQTDTLVATITPSDAIVTLAVWESSNTKVAKVDTNGVVTARAEGEAVITLTTNIGSARCVVNVQSGTLTINKEAIECNVYETTQLTVTKPEHKATARVSWKSSNSAVASVDSKGNVTGVAAGTAVISASVSGCSTAQCTISVKDVPFTLPRKFLIEHFTGDGCGYCPAGMYSIVKHINKSTTPYIWVSHHYGFNKDEYTIDESSVIGTELGIQGAPSISLNRTKQEPGDPFHPGYLPEITIKDNTKAAMSVKIDRQYDAQTRKLDITVSGESTFDTDTKFLLTVLIKENRLVGQQADYYYAYGQSKWKEYMHARVVRAVITKELGDTISIQNKAYSKTLSYTVPEKWVAENCCVVAYLTPVGKKPIINAEQVVLVEGTTGGEEYNPYGITESKGPKKSIVFHQVDANKIDGENVLEVLLVSNDNIETAYGPAQAVGLVYVNTEAEKLEAGTYPIQEGNTSGTITAGYRVDEKTSFGGSLLLYALSDYLTEGQLASAHIWRMNEGEMIVDENGNITFNFKTYSGISVNSTYTATSASQMPKVRALKGMKQYIEQIKNIKK